jgi:hypothetical protein
MPTVIQTEEYLQDSFPKTPPVGLREVYDTCNLALETSEDEPEAEVTSVRDRRSKYRFPAWKIPCPNCNSKVHFFPNRVLSTAIRALNGSFGL